MQEQEAELGLDDIVQMQYEVPTDEEIEQDVKDVIEEEGLQPPAAAPSPQGGVAGAPGPESVTGLSRKAAILLEIIAAASGADLDSKIAQFVDDIDEELLQLLQTRIDMVTKVRDHTAGPDCPLLQHKRRALFLPCCQRTGPDLQAPCLQSITGSSSYSEVRAFKRQCA